MKYMKKLITLLAVLTLALAMAVPAFAESSTGTITIDNAVTGTTYKAYRFLTWKAMIQTKMRILIS